MHHMSHEELLAKFLGLAPHCPVDSEGFKAVQSGHATSGPLSSVVMCHATIACMLDFIHSAQPEEKKSGHAHK